MRLSSLQKKVVGWNQAKEQTRTFVAPSRRSRSQSPQLHVASLLRVIAATRWPLRNFVHLRPSTRAISQPIDRDSNKAATCIACYSQERPFNRGVVDLVVVDGEIKLAKGRSWPTGVRVRRKKSGDSVDGVLADLAEHDRFQLIAIPHRSGAFFFVRPHFVQSEDAQSGASAKRFTDQMSLEMNIVVPD